MKGRPTAQPSRFYNPRDKCHTDAQPAAAHCPRTSEGTPNKMAAPQRHKKWPRGGGEGVILRRGCSLGSLSGASPPKLRRASAPSLRRDPYPALEAPAPPSLPPRPCRLGGGRSGSAQPGKWRQAPAGSSGPPAVPAAFWAERGPGCRTDLPQPHGGRQRRAPPAEEWDDSAQRHRS